MLNRYSFFLTDCGAVQQNMKGWIEIHKKQDVSDLCSHYTIIRFDLCEPDNSLFN